GDTGGGIVHDVVGDDRAREGELGKDRHLAAVKARIAAHLGVVGRIEPDRREGAIGYVVVGDDHPVGAEDVDAVPVLPVAAFGPVDVPDAVIGDDRTIRPVLA